MPHGSLWSDIAWWLHPPDGKYIVHVVVAAPNRYTFGAEKPTNRIEFIDILMSKWLTSNRPLSLSDFPWWISICSRCPKTVNFTRCLTHECCRCFDVVSHTQPKQTKRSINSLPPATVSAITPRVWTLMEYFNELHKCIAGERVTARARACVNGWMAYTLPIHIAIRIMKNDIVLS